MSTRLLTRAALVAALAVLCAPGAASAAFSVVPSPNAFSGDNMLNGVSASSATDAWAVGSLCCSIRNSGTGALLEHWDGSSWTAVLGPDARFQDETLNGVAAVSPSDAWAVGRIHQTGYGGGTPIILHWNGSSLQSIAPPSGVTGELLAVSSDMLGGAWAVGDDGHGHPLVLRCDVAACSAVPLPDVGPVGHLRGISSFAPDDVWAVGDTGNRTLALHWNGAAWTVVASPNPDPNVDILNAVGGASGDDLWAVGRIARNYADTGVPPGTRTLAMHWDGTAWNAVTTPNQDFQNTLVGVAATSPTAVTAVGMFEDTSGGGAVLRNLGMRWDGTSWGQLDMPNVGTADNLLRGAAAIPGTADVWAVGEYRADGGPVKTLVLRDTGPAPVAGESPPSGDAGTQDGTAAQTQAAPQTQTESAPQSQAATPQMTCGTVSVTLSLGNAGLRARRIRVSAGGMKPMLVGPRKRLRVSVPYTGADRATVKVRIRSRGGKVRTIRRVVTLCRAA